MYGLPQAGIIAQELLEERLIFWTHESRPTLYADAHHLINARKEDYVCKVDWEQAERYCRVAFKWDYNSRNRKGI